ncbi:leucine-rich repeat receptor protein kinase EMS1-like [Magnolia sinica]|uniref:leucine-rich repeat receptor protein kinase EMS1-like n=1 Tax=Magnolia sinica TaxID=86752 RepID=UPI002658C1DD|nr:leucine-rich repeat receptor protein kinase EMS1-like [Magnolia sinica]
MKGLDLSMVGRDWVHVMNMIPSLIKLRLPLCGLNDIPTSLSHINFTSLRVLDLQNNFFGSEFPPWIANLSNLVSLELNGCDLHGSIPMAIAELHHLQVINLGTNYNLTADLSVLLEGSWMAIKIMDLSENRFHGEIPISIGNLTSLVELNLGYNSIKGRIPKTIGNLCGLRKLNLYANMIEQIPDSLETAGCILQTPFANLAFLLLGGNPIHGSMPAWFGQLKRLEWLDLQDCLMTGSILESLGRLPFLNMISLYRNSLNGTLPTTFGQLSKLRYLDISSNTLTGIVSESHFEKLFELKTLMLSSNSLIFNISPTWVPPFRLEFIDLGSCRLGPRFPSWLSKQNLTQHLDLSNAAISDTIPNWFWDIASHLSHLNLSNNYIHGQLPSQISFSGWATVDLSSNSIQGPFPLPMKVSQLNLSNNSLVGPIPENINHVMQIASLLLVSGNQIDGTIPSAIGEMMYLRVLDLSRNNLHGSIPPTLGGCTQMEALDLSGNHLSGPIPESIGLLTHLQTVHLNYNNLSEELPSSMKNLSRLETLDLGENKFSGRISTWIGESFLSLRILRLRSNTFTGEIPSQISNLTSLQVLDLANNHLTGPIPSSLGNLTAMRTHQNRNILLAYGIYYNERIYIITFIERLSVSMQDKMFEYNKTLSLMTSMDLSEKYRIL